jgi:hypothetical protein
MSTITFPTSLLTLGFVRLVPSRRCRDVPRLTEVSGPSIKAQGLTGFSAGCMGTHREVSAKSRVCDQFG